MRIPVLLIDGSALAFIHANKPNYEYTVRNHMQRICDEINAVNYVMFLEKSKSNFRNEIATTNGYKANREANRDNINEYCPYLHDVFAHLKSCYKAVIYMGIENDDAISIVANEYSKGNQYEPVIVGDDSDLLSIEGLHYRLKKGLRMRVNNPGTMEFNDKKKLISTGLFNTYVQVIAGSAKENYKGLPKYGYVAAHKLLKDCVTEEEMRMVCFKEFVKVYGYRESVAKLEEGFRLSFLLRENKNFVLPKIQLFNN